MGKFIKANVIKPIPGFGYFANQEGSFAEDKVKELSEGGYISVIEEPKSTKEAKKEAKK
jgi:hypothetical protein